MYQLGHVGQPLLACVVQVWLCDEEPVSGSEETAAKANEKKRAGDGRWDLVEHVRVLASVAFLPLSLCSW